MSKPSNNDFKIVDEIISKTALTVNDKTNPEKYSAVVNRIILLLHQKDKPQHIEAIQKEITTFQIDNNPNFINYVNENCSKIKYDPRTKLFQLKSKYTIRNKDDLKELIRKSELGIVEDEELIDSYTGIKKDIESLKNENYVKVIKNDDTNKNTLFFRDLNNNIEKLLIDPIFKEAIEELRLKWRDENMNKGAIGEGKLISNRRKVKISNKGKKIINKNKRIQNTHINFVNEYLAGQVNSQTEK